MGQKLIRTNYFKFGIVGAYEVACDYHAVKDHAFLACAVVGYGDVLVQVECAEEAVAFEFGGDALFSFLKRSADVCFYI